jgi:hypothetical protein
MRTDWIVCKSGTGAAVCERCGESETPKLPMSVDAFVKWTRYFIAKHKDCKERAAE